MYRRAMSASVCFICTQYRISTHVCDRPQPNGEVGGVHKLRGDRRRGTGAEKCNRSSAAYAVADHWYARLSFLFGIDVLTSGQKTKLSYLRCDKLCCSSLYCIYVNLSVYKVLSTSTCSIWVSRIKSNVNNLLIYRVGELRLASLYFVRMCSI